MKQQVICKKCHKIKKTGAFSMFVKTIRGSFVGMVKEIEKLEKHEKIFRFDQAMDPEYLLAWIQEASKIVQDFLFINKQTNNFAINQFPPAIDTFMATYYKKESKTKQIFDAGRKIARRIAQTFKLI